MTFERSAIFSDLSPQEVAILLQQNEQFALPTFVPHAAKKMRAARELIRRGGYSVSDVVAEVTSPAWERRDASLKARAAA